MAIAFQASSESHTGATGATSVSSFSWSHALSSTSEGLAVFVYGFVDATDIITSVTVGGVSASLVGSVAASFAADTATEPGFVKVYFLSGASLPRTTSTITVNRTNNTTETYANAISVTAANLPVQIKGLIEFNENQSITSISIDDGGNVGSSLRIMGFYTGASVPPSADSNTVGIGGLNIDAGLYGAGTYYEAAAGSGARSIGFSAVHNDDTAAVCFAICETPPAGSIFLNTVSAYDNYENFAGTSSTPPTNFSQIGGGSVVCNGSGAAIASGTGTAVAVYQPSAAPYGIFVDQWAQAKVVTAILGTGFSGVVVRNQSGFTDGYYWRLGTSFYTLTKRATSGNVVLFTSSVAPAVNDVIKLSAIGNTLNCYVNGSLIGSVSDSSFADGRAGLSISGSGPSFDDLYVGSINDTIVNVSAVDSVVVGSASAALASSVNVAVTQTSALSTASAALASSVNAAVTQTSVLSSAVRLASSVNGSVTQTSALSSAVRLASSVNAAVIQTSVLTSIRGLYITNISPAKFDDGALVTLIGGGFGASQGQVIIGGVPQIINAWTNSNITFTSVRGIQSLGACRVNVATAS